MKLKSYSLTARMTISILLLFFASLLSAQTYNVIITVSNGPLGMMDAAVTLDGETVYTDFYGEAWFYSKATGTYPYTVTKAGFIPGSGSVTVVNDDVWEYVMLTPLPATFNVIITVSDGPLPVQDAEVILDGETVFTDFYGEAWFTDKPAGSYDYTVNKAEFYTYNGTATVIDDDVWEYVTLVPLTSSFNIIITVTDGPLGMIDAAVTLDGETVYTDFYGEAWFYGKGPGDYPYLVTKEGYYDANGIAHVANADVWEYVNMEPVLAYSAAFIVDDGSSPVEGAEINLDGIIAYTNAAGEAVFADLLPGTYSYTITLSGFEAESGDVIIESDNVTVEVTLIYSGVPELSNGQSIYPNPSNGIIHLENINGYKILITNQRGSLVASHQISNEQEMIDLSGQPAGFYNVRLINNNETISYKLLLVK